MPTRINPLSLASGALFLAIIVVVIWPRGLSDSDSGPNTPQAHSFNESPIRLNYLNPTPIGDPWEEHPWITHINTFDLTGDGQLEILACDARENRVKLLIRQPDGSWTEQAIGDPIEGPARVDFADIDQDGKVDLLVASMGMVLPNRERIGSVVVLENLGNLQFRNRVILEQTDRVTDVRAADLNNNGDLDLVVGQFGYDQGAIRWLEQTGPWEFKTHDLLLKSGTIHAIPADVDADGAIDIVALVSQEWEEIYCFFNDGVGNFTPRVLWGSTNQDYGSSGISLVDLDRNGDLDILYTNGDGFDYSNPGPRPWHGVQWLENRGNGHFARKSVGLMAGAFSPIAVDIDQDGDLDIVASSSSNDWGSPHAYSLVCFENTGNQQFVKRPLATSPTHLVAIHAADIDGDGYEEIVSAGFHAYPPWDDMSRLLIWDRP